MQEFDEFYKRPECWDSHCNLKSTYRPSFLEGLRDLNNELKQAEEKLQVLEGYKLLEESLPLLQIESEELEKIQDQTHRNLLEVVAGIIVFARILKSRDEKIAILRAREMKILQILKDMSEFRESNNILLRIMRIEIIELRAQIEEFKDESEKWSMDRKIDKLIWEALVEHWDKLNKKIEECRKSFKPLEKNQ